MIDGIDIWGDEDGEAWYAPGHHAIEPMVEAIYKWEDEVSGVPLDEICIRRETHEHYYVVQNPDNDERFIVVGPDFPGAKPMTIMRS